ncbi:unnamed protein product, partial [Mesorhabditis spiculigera]
MEPLSAGAEPVDETDQAGTSVEGQTCVVCSHTAHGIHFGVPSCRACAAFFRRSVVLDRKYSCRRINAECEISLDVRYLCRYCRFQKCVRVGMTPENVQWNRDRMSSSIKTGKKPKDSGPDTGENQPNDVESDKSPIDVVSDGSETGSPEVPVAKQKDRGDAAFFAQQFIEVSRMVEKIMNQTQPIEVISPFPLTALQRMAVATERFREYMPREGAVQLVHEIHWSTCEQDWFHLMQRAANWYMHSEEFSRLPSGQKFLIFRSTWSNFLRMEKVLETLLVLGEECIEKKLCLVGQYVTTPDTKYIMEDRVGIDPNEFIKYIKSQINNIFADLAVPLMVIAPEPLEFVYLLAMSAWNIDGRGVTPETVRVADTYRERISAELHDYYVHSKGVSNYAHRLIQLHEIIINNEKIQQDRSQMMHMMRIFDVFNFEIPNNSLFDIDRM